MAYNYDPNKYKKTFDNMFGAGSYNKGMQHAKKVGYWKAQPEIEKMKWKQRQEAFKEAERQRKEAEREAERAYKAQVAAEKKANAEKYRMQEKAKKQGRGGAMPSREQERKEAKIQSYYKKKGKFPKSIQDELDTMPTLSKSHIDSVHKGKKEKKKGKGKSKKKEKSMFGKIGNFFEDVGKDVKKSAGDTVKSVKNEAKRTGSNLKHNIEALNPFDDVSAKEANKKIAKNNKKFDKNKSSKEVVRQFNRVADSGSLGATSNIQKKLGLDTSYKKTRKLGKGGTSDVISEVVGSLAPGAASYKAADKLLKVGKIGKTLSKSKPLRELTRGAVAGAGFGAVQSTNDELYNPNHTAKDFIKNVGVNAAFGGLGDVGFHTLSSGLKAMKAAKSAGKSVPKNVMNDDPFNLSRFNGRQRQSVKGTMDGQSIVDGNAPRLNAPQQEAMRFLNGKVSEPVENMARQLSSPIVKDPAANFRKDVNIDGTPQLNAPLGGGRSANEWQDTLDNMNKQIPDEQTLNEFNDAIEKQVDYLRNSLANRGGVETGTTDNGLGGNFRQVTGRYTVSKNPGWYQDFYKQNGRAPNQSELRKIAESQVTQGFKDEFGDVPAWMPKAIDDLDQQAFDVNVAAPEGGQGVDEIMNTIDQQKEQVYRQYEKIINGNFNGTRSRKEAIERLMKGNPDLGGLTLKELEELANPLPDAGSPLKFKKSVQNRATKIVETPDGRRVVVPVYKEGDFVNYTANMSPNQRLAQRVEGNFTTRPSNDGIKMQTEQPLPFMKQEPALNFKKTIQQEIPRKDLTEIQTQEFAPDGSPAGYDYKNPQFKTRMFTQFFNDEVSDAASETSKHINRDAPGKFAQFKEKLLDKTQNFRTDWLDDLAPVEKLEKNVRGAVSSAEDSLYKQARLYRGSAERAHQVVNDQLSPIIKEVKANKIKMNDLVDYATAIHARNLNRQGINSGLSDAEIQKDIIRFESPRMESLRKKLVNASNDVLKKELVAAGNVSEEAYEAMRKKHPDYMPMFRHFDDDKVGFNGGISSAIANAQNPIKKMKGSDRDIIDPLEGMVKNMFNAVTQADKNRVGQQLAKLADEDSTGEFVRRLAPDEAKERKNVISVFEKGEKAHFEVQPDVYKSLKSLDRESSNTLIKILSKPASTLRAGATLTPEFSLRNVFRDVPAAAIVSESGFNPLTDFPIALWDAMSIKIGGKTIKDKGKLYKDFIEHNGGYGNIVSNDRNLHQEVIKNVLKEGDSPKFRNIVNPNSWLDVLRAIADVSESGVKLGEYRAALRKGASPQEAAYRARDIMDFARSGNSVREANKVVAFLNANIQGKDKLARAFMKNPVAFTGKSVAMVTVPTIGASLAAHYLANDEQKKTIKDAPAWLKNTFWLVPIPGTNQIARVPKPFDIAPLFANGVERAIDYAIDKNPNAFDKFAKESFSSAAIPMMMSGLTPLVEGMANYSFFRQGSIDPMRDQNKEYPDRYDAKTSETAKIAARGINALTGGEGSFKNFGSPRVVENTVRGLFGGLGTYGMDAVDKVVTEPIQKLSGTHDGIKAPAKQINQQPILRSFLVDQGSTGESTSKLYDFLNKIKKQKGSGKSYNEQEYDLAKSATGQIGDITKDMRKIENSRSMSPIEKRRRLEELNKQRNQIARRAASSLN